MEENKILVQIQPCCSYSSDEDLHSSSNAVHTEPFIPVEIPSKVKNSHTSQRRPRIPGLQKDIKILKSELLQFITQHGQEGFMPMRKQLRIHGRIDIEKAISNMGGFRKIATLMNLSLSYKKRKPKGYWDNLENLQVEVSFHFPVPNSNSAYL